MLYYGGDTRRRGSRVRLRQLGIEGACDGGLASVGPRVGFVGGRDGDEVDGGKVGDVVGTSRESHHMTNA